MFCSLLKTNLLLLLKPASLWNNFALPDKSYRSHITVVSPHYSADVCWVTQGSDGWYDTPMRRSLLSIRELSSLCCRTPPYLRGRRWTCRIFTNWVVPCRSAGAGQNRDKEFVIVGFAGIHWWVIACGCAFNTLCCTPPRLEEYERSAMAICGDSSSPVEDLITHIRPWPRWLVLSEIMRWFRAKVMSSLSDPVPAYAWAASGPTLFSTCMMMGYKMSVLIIAVRV